MADSQTILTRILRMQCLGFRFSPVPCGNNICVRFEHHGWEAVGEAYHDDLALAVFTASKGALRDLARRKRAHRKACIEAQGVFTEFNPEEGKL